MDRPREFAHTPGPWRLASDEFDSYDTWIETSDGQGVIARVNVAYFGSAEGQANARLLAEGPQLANAVGLALDALRRCRPQIVGALPQQDADYAIDLLSRALSGLVLSPVPGE